MAPMRPNRYQRTNPTDKSRINDKTGVVTGTLHGHVVTSLFLVDLYLLHAWSSFSLFGSVGNVCSTWESQNGCAVGRLSQILFANNK